MVSLLRSYIISSRNWVHEASLDNSKIVNRGLENGGSKAASRHKDWRLEKSPPKNLWQKLIQEGLGLVLITCSMQ